MRIVPGKRIPWPRSAEDPETLWQLWEHGYQGSVLSGKTMYSSVALHLPTPKHWIALETISQCDDTERYVRISARDCLIGRPENAFEDLDIVATSLEDPKLHGFMKFLERPMVLVKLAHWLNGNFYRGPNNRGVEVEQLEPNKWRLRFCEGVKYIQFDALVVDLMLIEDEKEITETEWGPKNMVKAMKRRVIASDFIKDDDPRILNPEDRFRDTS